MHNRAYALLVSQLSSEQRSSLERTGKFQVFTGHGLARRRFWVENTARTTYTVHGWFMRYCLISSDRSLPYEDETLLRKLLLEVSPNTFFKNANSEFREWVYGAFIAVAAMSTFAVVVGAGIFIWRYFT